MICNNEVKILIDELISNLKKNRNIEEIRLFGSQCNNYNPKSDIDVLIILKNEKKGEILYKSISQLIDKYKILIHPVIFTKKEFEFRKNMPSFDEYFFTQSRILYKRNQNTLFENIFNFFHYKKFNK